MKYLVGYTFFLYAPFSGCEAPRKACTETLFREAFSGAFFRNFVPEKPSGKNTQGVKEGVKPHLPKSLQGKIARGLRRG